MNNQSPEINHVATALAKVQGEMKHADKGTPGVYSKYASYEQIVEALRTSLSKNDLAYSHSSYQIPGEEDRDIIHIGVSTTLIHGESGQYLRSTIELPVDIKDCGKNQQVHFEFGKVTTYLKRYTLAGITGLGTGEDDSEDKGEGKPKEPKRTKKEKKVEPQEPREPTPNEQEIINYLNKNSGTLEKLEKAHAEVLAKTNKKDELAFANKTLKQLKANLSE